MCSVGNGFDRSGNFEIRKQDRFARNAYFICRGRCLSSARGNLAKFGVCGLANDNGPMQASAPTNQGKIITNLQCAIRQACGGVGAPISGLRAVIFNPGWPPKRACGRSALQSIC